MAGPLEGIRVVELGLPYGRSTIRQASTGRQAASSGSMGSAPALQPRTPGLSWRLGVSRSQSWEAKRTQGAQTGQCQ